MLFVNIMRSESAVREETLHAPSAYTVVRESAGAIAGSETFEAFVNEVAKEMLCAVVRFDSARWSLNC